MHFRYVLAALIIVLLSAEFTAQNTLTDSLERALLGLRGKERITALSDLTWELSGVHADKAVQYGRELLKLAEQTNDSTEIGEAANLLAVAFYRHGNYEEALRMNRRAYRIRKTAGDRKAIGSSLNKFVNIYTDQIKLDSALKYGLESVKIYEQLADSGNLAVSLNTISSVYQKERDWQATLTYAKRSYDIASAIGFDYAVGGSAGSMGLAYEALNQFDLSIYWYEIARAAFERVDSKSDLATLANNLGFLYRRQGSLESAQRNYELALQMAEELSESNGIAHYSANLGGLFNARKDYQKAQAYFTRALEIAEREKLGRIRLQCYDGLSEALVNSGRGSEASRYFRQYIDLKDSLYNEERSAQLAEMRTIYETEKKEQENAFLITENQLKDKRTRAIAVGSAAAFLLLILSGTFYYQSYRRRQEARLQRELLAERELGMAAVFDATEEERRRIAKDLHDGIGQQLSGLKLSWDALRHRVKEFLPEENVRFEQLAAVLDESAQEVRSISHQMMPRALQERGLLPALEDMLRKSLGLTPIQFRIEHFKVDDQRFDQRVEIGLYRIAQELINNIIKHSGASEVALQLYRSKSHLILIIEDNGRGFSPEEKKDGIGLLNIASRLSVVNGEVNWEPGPESGTVATVRVPVKA